MRRGLLMRNTWDIDINDRYIELEGTLPGGFSGAGGLERSCVAHGSGTSRIQKVIQQDADRKTTLADGQLSGGAE
jgi:hypothetical protein